MWLDLVGVCKAQIDGTARDCGQDTGKTGKLYQCNHMNVKKGEIENRKTKVHLLLAITLRVPLQTYGKGSVGVAKHQESTRITWRKATRPLQTDCMVSTVHPNPYPIGMSLESFPDAPSLVNAPRIYFDVHASNLAATITDLLYEWLPRTAVRWQGIGHRDAGCKLQSQLQSTRQFSAQGPPGFN